VIAMKEFVVLSLVFTFYSCLVICHEEAVVEQTVMIIFKDWCQSHKTLFLSLTVQQTKMECLTSYPRPSVIKLLYVCNLLLK
jgi:hypothetical protein